MYVGLLFLAAPLLAGLDDSWIYASTIVQLVILAVLASLSSMSILQQRMLDYLHSLTAPVLAEHNALETAAMETLDELSQFGQGAALIYVESGSTAEAEADDIFGDLIERKETDAEKKVKKGDVVTLTSNDIFKSIFGDKVEIGHLTCKLEKLNDEPVLEHEEVVGTQLEAKSQFIKGYSETNELHMAIREQDTLNSLLCTAIDVKLQSHKSPMSWSAQLRLTDRMEGCHPSEAPRSASVLIKSLGYQGNYFLLKTVKPLEN